MALAKNEFYAIKKKRGGDFVRFCKIKKELKNGIFILGDKYTLGLVKVVAKKLPRVGRPRKAA